MKWRRSVWAAWVLCVCCCGCVLAAARFGVGSGLPSLSVTAIARDGAGLIWLATEDGVVRFDGHRMLPLALDRPDGLPDLGVKALLALDSEVLIATEARLLRYELQRAEAVEWQFEGRSIAGVQALVRGPDGTWFAASQDGSVWQGRRGSAQLERVLAPSPTLRFSALALARDGLWLSANTGAYHLELASKTLKPVRFDAPDLDDGARDARAIAEFPAGVLWIGYWNDALVRLDLSRGEHRWFQPGTPAAGALRASSIYQLLPHEDAIYIGSNRGLVVWREDCACLRGLNLPQWDMLDGSGVVVQALWAEGSQLWAGVFGEGAVLFDALDRVFQNQVKVDGRSDRLAHSMVRALKLTEDGRLWIGTYGGGLQLSLPGQRPDGLGWPLVSVQGPARRGEERLLWSIEAGTDEALLLGTGAGLLRWRDGRTEPVDPRVESIRVTVTRADGRRYIGAQSGLYRLDADRLQPIALPGAGARTIWSLQENAGELWVGGAAGLYRLDAQDQVSRHWTVAAAPEGVPGAVFVQKSGADGQRWLGTQGGLVQLGPDGQVRVPQGLQRSTLRAVSSIEVDRAGRLWLGSRSGLWLYEPVRGRAQRFDMRDGLFGDSFSTGASAQDAGGTLYFGGTGGLLRFDPAAIQPARARPMLRPSLTRLRIGQQEWRGGGMLVLPADHEALRLDFAAGHYTRSDDLRYAVRWHGVDGRRTELGDAASTLVQRLPGGVHALELTASLAGQPESAQTRTVLVVDVAFPWHQTWWGRSLVLVALLLAGLLLVWWRTAAIARQRHALTEEVARRTRELQQTTAALEQSNAQLLRMAHTDPLTGLANRRSLFEQAERWQREGQQLAVMMIDIDHFKSLNDRHGHASGDRVLQVFGAMLTPSGERQISARYGGEEFLCLYAGMPATELEQQVVRLIERVRAQALDTGSGEPVRWTISIGLALADPNEAFATGIKRADAALYAAKQQRDSWRWASPGDGLATPSQG